MVTGTARDEDEAVGLDPFAGLEDEVRNDRADANARAVGGSLDDEALVLVVARVLPLGHDLDAVTDLERFGAIAGDRLFHARR